MREVRLPRLLDDGMQELARLHPVQLRIDCQLAPVSGAEMTLGPEEHVALRQMIELFSPQGSAGVFRVSGVTEDENGLQQVRLTHGLTTLSDALIPAEGDSVGSAEDVLGFLLSHQEDVWWQLGAVEATAELSCHYDATNLLKALVDLMEELPGYHLAFDQTTRPWTLHVRANTAEAACEVRLSRNLQSLRISRDDSELCTRLYVSTLDAPLEASTIGQWGAVSRWMTADDELDEALVLRAAQQYLTQHQEPKLTVTMNALELCEATGEPLDRFTLGTLCRVALPDRGQTVLQRVVALSYRDVYGQPTAVQVTLASRVSDTADAIAGLVLDTRLLYQGQAKSRIRLKATHQEVDDLKTKYATVLIDLNAVKAELLLKATQSEVDALSRKVSSAEIRLDGAEAAIALKANQSFVDELEKRLSAAEILIDGANARIDLKASLEEVNALGKRVSAAEIAIDGANARIDLKASLAEVNDLETRVSAAEIAIDGANARIDLKASLAEVNDLETRVSAAEIAIDGANARIDLKASATVVDELGKRVSSAEISIDGLNSEISLKANKIDLQGYVTASELETEVLQVVNSGSIETLAVGFIGCGDIHAETINCDAVNTGPLEADSATIDVLTATNLSATTVASNYGVFINGIDMGGKSMRWQALTVPNNLTGLSKTYADVYYMDADGTEQYVRVLTNVELRMSGNATFAFAVSDA